MKKIIRNIDLARKSMISDVHICNILSGKSRCTLKTATSLYKAGKSLGVDIPPEMWIDGDRDHLKTLLRIPK